MSISVGLQAYLKPGIVESNKFSIKQSWVKKKKKNDHVQYNKKYTLIVDAAWMDAHIVHWGGKPSKLYCLQDQNFIVS